MVVDFTDMIGKTNVGIQMLIRHHDCIAWEEFSDHGNPCVDPYVFDTKIERQEDALMHAAVKVALPKGSATHVRLAELVARDLNNKYVTYDWLIKTVSRVLGVTSLSELRKMIELSTTVKARLKDGRVAERA
ncbi:MAG: hypothetical protein PUJ52_01395 [Firmicutes bacterium]|nr:hypothetical protein [Bacillota bacterium]